jgi:hypothetical protein
MKLISMTSFVKKQGNIGMEIQSLRHQQSDRARRFYLIQKYADFLSKEITKGMFVPCDEFDNILKEPEPYYENKGFDECPEPIWDNLECEQFLKAKERILFKDFQVVNLPIKQGYYSKSITDSSGLLHLFWYSKVSENWSLSQDLNIIETLTFFNSIELTETAIKEIGL